MQSACSHNSVGWQWAQQKKPTTLQSPSQWTSIPTTPSLATKKKTLELPPEELKHWHQPVWMMLLSKMPDPKDSTKLEEVATSLHGCQLSQLKVEQICKLCLLLGIPKYKGKGKLVCQLLIVYTKKFQSIPHFLTWFPAKQITASIPSFALWMHISIMTITTICSRSMTRRQG